MLNLEELRAHIVSPDREIAERTQKKLDNKTKPRRSLGRLEDLEGAVHGAKLRPDIGAQASR